MSKNADSHGVKSTGCQLLCCRPARRQDAMDPVRSLLDAGPHHEILREKDGKIRSFVSKGLTKTRNVVVEKP